jgi:glycosyltransferase involved in cell wall biosynthesis
MIPPDSVTVIIPTTCSDERDDGLRRAVRSLATQDIGCPSILIVANGPRVNSAILQEIASHPQVNVVRLAEGSLPRALAFGRSRVATPYFGFLDDDDEYLPNALRIRLQALEGDSAAATCATNGYDFIDGRDHMREDISSEAQHDPLRGLLRANWLASCGGLFRSDFVQESFFDNSTKYFEWTLLAYKLATSRRVVLLTTPTYRLHESPDSLSQSEAYRLSEPRLIETLLAFDLPEDVRQELEKRVSKAQHAISDYYLHRGELRNAWIAHLRSLRQPGGLRYLTYTRKLLLR